MKTFQQFCENTTSISVGRENSAAKTRATLEQQKAEADTNRESQQIEQRRRATAAEKDRIETEREQRLKNLERRVNQQ